MIVFALSDYRCLQFFHRVKFSSVIDSLLKAPDKAPGLRSGLFGGQMSSFMKSPFSVFQIVNCIESCVLARRTAEVSICDDGIFLRYQTIGPFPG